MIRECCNGACGWRGETRRMLGSIGPLCPDCGEVTEPMEEAVGYYKLLVIITVCPSSGGAAISTRVVEFNNREAAEQAYAAMRKQGVYAPTFLEVLRMYED